MRETTVMMEGNATRKKTSGLHAYPIRVAPRAVKSKLRTLAFCRRTNVKRPAIETQPILPILENTPFLRRDEGIRSSPTGTESTK